MIATDRIDEAIWPRLDALVDRASIADVVSHRLEVVASRRYRSTGRAVPAAFAQEERLAALRSLIARPLLERIASLYDAPIVLIKGPEVAGLYPEAQMRSFVDLDLLVEDPLNAQAALRSAGFEQVRGTHPTGIHHLEPLVFPSLPLPVEIHSRLHWIETPACPTVPELLEIAGPSRLGVAGISALPPEHHLLVLAVHSWAHEPLRRLRDLLDVAVTLPHADIAAVERLAERWGIGRLWRTTLRATESVFYDRAAPLALRTWGRNVLAARERTVLEDHLERWFSDFSVMSPGRALARMTRDIAADLLPEKNEPWSAKRRRSLRALSNARRPRSVHQDELDDRGIAGPSRRIF